MNRPTEKPGKLPPDVQLSLGAELRRSLSSWAYRLPMHLVGLASRATAPWAGPAERSSPDEPVPWTHHNALDPERIATLDTAFEHAWADLQAVGHPATKEELARCLVKLAPLEREPSLLASKAVIAIIQTSRKHG